MKSTSLQGIGLMCGTSQDALDLADVRFTFDDGHIGYEVVGTQTTALPNALQEKLSHALSLNAFEFLMLDKEVGRFFGETVAAYVRSANSTAQFVASHGITSFHQPKRRLTHQLGSGAVIAAVSELAVVNGFREQDVALGGQGAPLVPYCDQLLFNAFDATLNLGGFANISRLNGEALLGFDICPANLLLNHFARQLGQDYDRNGEGARAGTLLPTLLDQWNGLSYYQQSAPKSLGKEWLDEQILTSLNGGDHDPHDLLQTAAHHISDQIGAVLDFEGKCLVTGGGAFNAYLVELIREKSTTSIHIPDEETISFKEAICFALLGALRLREEQNIASTVTGARQASSAGYVHLPPFQP